MIYRVQRDFGIKSWFKDLFNNIKTGLKKAGHHILSLFKNYDPIIISHHSDENNLKESTFSEISLNEIPDSVKDIIDTLSNIKTKLEINYRNSQSDERFANRLPSFYYLVPESMMNRHRKNYIEKYNQDWSEVLYLYGGDLVLSYDFKEEYWFVMDKTYSPQKHFKITDSRKSEILKVIRNFFDESKDQYLANFIKQFENKEETYKSIISYLKFAREIIK